MRDEAALMARLDVLAGCSDSESGITRLFLSPAHARAVPLVEGWMRAAGLSTRLDASGTLVGRREGPWPGAPLLVLGSHIDSVRNAGRYDGCLGVLAAITLAERLRDVALPYALEIRGFGDEEGVRFPVTLTGAHAAAGKFETAWLGVRDRDGVSLGEALAGFGLDPARIGDCRAEGAFAYLELHIEQGPVLEAVNLPLGVVTAISGAARFEVSVTGVAGHAGTVPMAQRRDALVAAAEMVLAVRRVALDHGVVASVGQIAVTPGAVNVIPGGCVFSIDLRAPLDDQRHLAEEALMGGLDEVAGAHGVTVAVRQTHDAPAVACDGRLQAALADGIAEAGCGTLYLPSGAGHDAMAVAALCPIGMMFVRCTGGSAIIRMEAVLLEDVAAALQAMEITLRRIDPTIFATTASPHLFG